MQEIIFTNCIHTICTEKGDGVRKDSDNENKKCVEDDDDYQNNHAGDDDDINDDDVSYDGNDDVIRHESLCKPSFRAP